jgi:FkbM family methyltransferase
VGFRSKRGTRLRRVLDGADRVGLGRPLRRLTARIDPTYRRRYEQGGRDDRNLRALFDRVLQVDSDCIDVGANRGQVLDEIVRRSPQGHHMAYEPIPRLAADLRRRFPSVDVREAALSDVAGMTTFVHMEGAEAYSGLRQRTEGAAVGRGTPRDITVAVECLDEAVPRDHVPTLIKVDVEGAQYGVFLGGRRILRACRPILVFEHGRGAEVTYGTTALMIYGLLVDEIGYAIYGLAGEGPFSGSQFASIVRNGSLWNFVAADPGRANQALGIGISA